MRILTSDDGQPGMGWDGTGTEQSSAVVGCFQSTVVSIWQKLPKQKNIDTDVLYMRVKSGSCVLCR